MNKDMTLKVKEALPKDVGRAIVRIDPDFAHHSDFLRWMERVWPLDESTGLPAARPMGNPDVTGFVRKNWLHWKNRMEDSIGPVFLDSPPRAQTAMVGQRKTVRLVPRALEHIQGFRSRWQPNRKQLQRHMDLLEPLRQSNHRNARHTQSR